MAQVAHGTFAARTSVGDQTISGLAFAPRAVIFFCSLRTATGIGPTSSSCELMVGWDCNGSGGPFPCVASTWAKDNVAATVMGGASNTGQCIQLSGTGAAAGAESQAQVSAWHSDGFTLTYASAATQAWLINYLAIGGDDITDAHSGVFLLSTSSGDQSTGVPNFLPSFLMMAHGNDNFGFGFASGPDAANQATVYGIDAPGENPTQTGRSFSPGSVQGGWRAFGSIPRTLEVDYLASLKSFDATGFTLTKSNPPAAGRSINYLVLEGGTFDVGVTTVPAATGVQQVPVGVNPAGVLMFSGLEPSGSAVVDLLASIGGFDGGLSAGTAAFAAEDNVTPTVVEQYSGAEALAADVDYAGPSVPSLADPESLSIGSFSLDWTAVSGDEEQYAYWAIGGPVVVPPQQIIRYNRRPRAS